MTALIPRPRAEIAPGAVHVPGWLGGRPWTDVALESGDLFVFGGPSRFAYNGVPKTVRGTGPPDIGLRGRLNITLRESGLG